MRPPSPVLPLPRLIGGKHACFLDVDGTLLDIVQAPGHVRAAPAVVRMVQNLDRALGGAVALVTGRRILDVDKLFAPLRPCAAGQYGLERRSAAGKLHWRGKPASEIPALLMKIHEWASWRRGLIVEDKGCAIAVHYRAAPHLAGEVRRFLEDTLKPCAGYYCLQPGKMVLEIVPEGGDKGTAVLDFMSEPPFANKIPVFVGDDVSDEKAFSVVNRMGGVTIKVGPGATIAQLRLEDFTEVRTWISRSLRTMNPIRWRE